MNLSQITEIIKSFQAGLKPPVAFGISTLNLRVWMDIYDLSLAEFGHGDRHDYVVYYGDLTNVQKTILSNMTNNLIKGDSAYNKNQEVLKVVENLFAEKFDSNNFCSCYKGDGSEEYEVGVKEFVKELKITLENQPTIKRATGYQKEFGHKVHPDLITEILKADDIRKDLSGEDVERTIIVLEKLGYIKFEDLK
jgi:hypothetical protein